MRETEVKSEIPVKSEILAESHHSRAELTRPVSRNSALAFPRQVARTAVCHLDSRCGVGWRLQRRVVFALLNAIHWRRFYAHAIPILCYHAIPSRSSFEVQMACIQERGWTVVGLRDVIAWIGRQKTLKLPAIVLTFDDCYTTQFTNAVPVLTQFGYPAAFFAVSQRIGQHLDWDGPKGGTGHSLMGRDELLELRQRGFDVGCHSRTHPKLSDIPSELQEMEIRGGKQDIENILG
jgi:hypothetical protein